MRMTNALVQVAIAMLNSSDNRFWGYDLSKEAGVTSPVLYRILRRMLEDGWVTDGWEDPTTITAKRPPRRYYVLTERGRSQLGAVRERARQDARFRDLNFGVA
jgi:PadR family transcriptional regulator PadR